MCPSTAERGVLAHQKTPLQRRRVPTEHRPVEAGVPASNTRDPSSAAVELHGADQRVLLGDHRGQLGDWAAGGRSRPWLCQGEGRRCRLCRRRLGCRRRLKPKAGAESAGLAVHDPPVSWRWRRSCGSLCSRTGQPREQRGDRQKIAPPRNTHSTGSKAAGRIPMCWWSAACGIQEANSNAATARPDAASQATAVAGLP